MKYLSIVLVFRISIRTWKAALAPFHQIELHIVCQQWVLRYDTDGTTPDACQLGHQFAGKNGDAVFGFLVFEWIFAEELQSVVISASEDDFHFHILRRKAAQLDLQFNSALGAEVECCIWVARQVVPNKVNTAPGHHHLGLPLDEFEEVLTIVICQQIKML